jgi:uncharacterized protein (TIGR01777 family)
MRIVVGGSSGLIGSALVRRLQADGHEVVRLVRRTAAGSDEVSWSPADGVLDPAALAGADVAINLAGAGVGDHRWTDAYKETIRRSRVDSTVTLSRAIAAAGNGPRVLLNASAIGYYGSRGDEVLTEQSTPGDSFLSDVARAWESGTQAAEEAGVRVCNLRSGLVLSAAGGLLERVTQLFRYGIGGKLGTGKQFMSWVSLADEISAIKFLMTHDDVAGPVNLTGPEPVRNSEFTKVLGELMRRPTVFPAPAFGIRMVLGQFSEDVLASIRAVPSVLTDAGFVHQHKDVRAALQWALTDSQ